MFFSDDIQIAFLQRLEAPPSHVRNYSDLNLEPPLKLTFIDMPVEATAIRLEYLVNHTFTFKVEEFKSSTFDTQIKDILKGELQKFHPFFKHGLDAITAGNYTFILFDSSDNKIPKEVVESMATARAVTDSINKKIYIKKGDQQDFLASLSNELVHALYNKTGSTYKPLSPNDDPIKMGIELMKPSLEQEDKGSSLPTSVEEDFYQIITQEVCSKVLEEAIKNVIQDKDFSISFADVANQSFSDLKKAYSIILAKAVFGEAITGRLRDASNKVTDTQPEFVAFYTRLKRFLESDRCEKEVFEKIKAWGFKTQ